MQSGLHSYPSIFNLGHRAVAELTKHPVVVEEKIDGSQISFARMLPSEEYPDGQLAMRSKGAPIHIDAPEGMFKKAVQSVLDHFHLLMPGWTYRGEYLAKPKHNALCYERTPKDNIILFDVNTGEEEYRGRTGLEYEADRIGFEFVPCLFSGMVESADFLRGFLDRISVLGGQKIEGVVLKPLHRDLFGQDKKLLMAKFVSEAFKEVHAAEWKKENPSSGDILTNLGNQYRSPARWQKAVQHLREAGKLENSPRDIGVLIREIPEDVLKECEADIKDALFKWAWPHVRRMVIGGFPKWYKEELLKKQFEG